MQNDTRGVDLGGPVRLRVRLLGAVEVIMDGRRVPAFNALRLQRSLALIALRSDLRHRSRLAFELWPDSDERQARTNLRKLIHDLRHSLPDIGEFVEIDNEIVHWIATGPSEVDVLRFRRALAVGDLELAGGLYGGDLLPSCYDEWILRERDRLRQEAYAAFMSLAEGAAARADPEASIRHARRALELEPTDAAAVGALMRGHVTVGDRAAALRSYHRYSEALEREFGLEPGEEVEALYQRCRGGSGIDRSGQTWAPPLVEHEMSDPAPTASTSVAEAPFVGRDPELDRLVDAWSDTKRGGARFVLLSGEAGIGKSRLATELGKRVRAEGHAAVATRAYEAAGRLPWGPVVDLLRSDALWGHVTTLEAVWRDELGRLLPELADATGVDTHDRVGDVAQRHRLFDAVNRALTAGDRPRLLIIDDLQWCDTETIELIGFVVRSGKAAPVLIVGTARLEEVRSDHPLDTLVGALDRDGSLTTIDLGRLDEAATATLAARLSTEELEGTLTTRLWDETEGNPLFIIEALRAGISSAAGSAVLTPTMRSVLSARLGQLPDGARRLAEVAAVIGRAFTVRLVASVAELNEDDLADNLDELWRRRIIRDQGATYDFSHDKLRAVTLEALTPARRRRLHRAVAEAIAQELQGDPSAASARLAAHYDQAGMVEAAVGAYQSAGARAVAVSALDEAVSMFRRALSLLAEMPSTPDRDALELELRIALGSPLVAIEGYGSSSAHRLYERALALCRRLGRPITPPILRGLGLARLQGCRFDDCSDLGQALVDHESRDPIAVTEGHYLLGVSTFWRGDPGAARAHLLRALGSYELSRRDEHLASYAQDPKAVCLVRLAWIELWTGDPDRARETAESAMEIGLDLDHPMTLAYVATYAAIMAAEAGDLSRLEALLEEAEVLWSRLQMGYLKIVADALRGWLDVVRGAADGLDAIVQSVTRSRAEGETLHLTYCLLLLARARGVVGALDEGRAATREGLVWSREHNQRYLEAELSRVDGELAYRSGQAEAARAGLRHAVELASAQGARWLELRALHSLSRRFPDPSLRARLAALVQTIPSGHRLPAFQAAAELVNEAG